MLATLVVAGLLLAHGLIHLCYLMPVPAATAGGPAWPFSVSGSWLVVSGRTDADALRRATRVLVAVTVVAFALASMTAIGTLPAGTWVPLVVLGSLSSLGLLGVTFRKVLGIGAAIDVALLALVTVAGWQPQPL